MRPELIYDVTIWYGVEMLEDIEYDEDEEEDFFTPIHKHSPRNINGIVVFRK